MKHFLKIYTETDVNFRQQFFDTNVNFRQQSFDTNIKYLFNEAYYHESMKERSYLISEFQNNLKHSRS